MLKGVISLIAELQIADESLYQSLQSTIDMINIKIQGIMLLIEIKKITLEN
jgi:hypothetical protein